MEEKFRKDLQGALASKFPGMELVLLDGKGRIDIDVNEAYYFCHSLSKNTDTVNVSGESKYIHYKNINRRISLSGKKVEDIPTIVEKVCVKVKKVRKLLDEAYEIHLKQERSKEDILDSLKEKYQADKVEEISEWKRTGKYRLYFGNITVDILKFNNKRIIINDVDNSPECIQALVEVARKFKN